MNREFALFRSIISFEYLNGKSEKMIRYFVFTVWHRNIVY